MQNRPLVVLLGNSLLMDGVALSLTCRETLGVVRLETGTDDIRDRLRSLKPELIVFELDNPYTQTIMSLTKDQPDMLLVGLDLDCSQAIVLNSRQQPTRSMNDLQHLVQTAVGLETLAPSETSEVVRNDTDA